MKTLIAFCVTSQVPVYWPPNLMHYGICTNCLLYLDWLGVPPRSIHVSACHTWTLRKTSIVDLATLGKCYKINGSCVSQKSKQAVGSSKKNQRQMIKVNPFLSVHIPYVQSEGILPQIRLLQWRAYIFRNTQCFSTKLGRKMVNALFCHKTLEYWWPLTYIQGHVIQDGCQIQSEKSILGQKIAITRPIFWQIW